ncbi:hypothetical protein [Bordetella sp. FB-8]|uniref:hypothetical protein n=1 Tax=Bordetella sp. FB-8 TaxID=1159870 RepID=UPI0003740296|nr:hypothetical protein [Bordetella sp. FB-8]
MVSEQFQRRLCHLSLRVGIRSGIIRRILVYIVIPMAVWMLLSWYPKAQSAPSPVVGKLAVPTAKPVVEKSNASHPAQEASRQDETPKPAVTVSDLDAVMQQEILYKAMTQRAQQRAALAKYSDGDNASLITPSLPRVLWRRASTAGWVGKFSFDGGTTVVAGRGDMLPGGFTVSEINDRTVQVTRDGKSFNLLSVDVPTSSQAEDTRAAQPGASLPMNPMMGMTRQTPTQRPLNTNRR